MRTPTVTKAALFPESRCHAAGTNGAPGLCSSSSHSFVLTKGFNCSIQNFISLRGLKRVRFRALLSEPAEIETSGLATAENRR